MEGYIKRRTAGEKVNSIPQVIDGLKEGRSVYIVSSTDSYLMEVIKLAADEGVVFKIERSKGGGWLLTPESESWTSVNTLPNFGEPEQVLVKVWLPKQSEYLTLCAKWDGKVFKELETGRSMTDVLFWKPLPI